MLLLYDRIQFYLFFCNLTEKYYKPTLLTNSGRGGYNELAIK